MRRFIPNLSKTASRRLDRPALLLLAALLLALTAALACAGSAPAPAAPTAAPAATQPPAAAQPTAVATAPPAVMPTSPPAIATPAATAMATTAPEPTDIPAATNPPAAAVPTEPAAPAAPTEPAADADGRAFTVGEGSEATFTVNEKLAWLDLPNDAVMRTEALSGMVYLDGRPSVIDIDLHSLTSDANRRDRYVRQRMFPDNPIATFTVNDLGDLPNPLPAGEVIAREVTGELAVRGVVKPITFTVEARRDPDALFILGNATFTWDELEIPPPNIPGRIQVKDEVSVSVLLSAIPEPGS